MENQKILLALISVTLIFSIINLYITFDVYKVNIKYIETDDNQRIQPDLKININIDDDPIKGNKDAPVTIIEFSDFQCPYCSKFYMQILPQLEENYIKTGKVRFIYKDFPLSFHPLAQKTAEAAECADEQGKFWEYHNKIFSDQQYLSMQNLKQWAYDLNLDTNKFNNCLDSGQMFSEVQKDLKDGEAHGVSGTPAFFVNNRFISGAQPFTVFKQIIDAELTK